MPVNRSAPLRAASVLALLLATALAAVLLPLPPAQAAAGPAIGGVVPGRYLVTVRPDAAIHAVVHALASKGGRVERVHDEALHGLTVRMDAATARGVAADPRVDSVEADRWVRVASATQFFAPWGLDRVDQRALPLSATYTWANNGAGVRVYVVDTGVRATHTDFGGRVVAGFDALGAGTTEDCNGHGTHVAGTVAGAHHGVAKGATIVPVRVLGCDGWGTLSSVVAGVEWITANRPPGQPAVANLSIGGGASAALDTAVTNSIASGVTFVVAAGNSNTDACTTSPARVGAALTVGATTRSDARAAYSNWGSCVKLFAPGSGVVSAYHTSTSATATMSGTSMAAPHVAGAAALLLASSPQATPAQVHDRLLAAATAGVVSGAGLLSPNRLLFTGATATAPVADPVPSTEPAPAPAPAPAPPPPPPEVVTVPGAPTGVTAVARSGAADVAWTAPSNGGAPISRYTVRAHMAAFGGRVTTTVTVSGNATSVRVPGLWGGTAYYFTVAAENSAGVGAFSAPSNTVTAAW
ncbi:MAG TPA: S8 family serine peptidase [Egibacteraceae bacterium]|nr:S8 family serine peptidase [Egibacteraceae bacterium]